MHTAPSVADIEDGIYYISNINNLNTHVGIEAGITPFFQATIYMEKITDELPY